MKGAWRDRGRTDRAEQRGTTRAACSHSSGRRRPARAAAAHRRLPVPPRAARPTVHHPRCRPRGRPAAGPAPLGGPHASAPAAGPCPWWVSPCRATRSSQYGACKSRGPQWRLPLWHHVVPMDRHRRRRRLFRLLRRRLCCRLCCRRSSVAACGTDRFHQRRLAGAREAAHADHRDDHPRRRCHGRLTLAKTTRSARSPSLRGPPLHTPTLRRPPSPSSPHPVSTRPHPRPPIARRPCNAMSRGKRVPHIGAGSHWGRVSLNSL